MTPYDTHMTLKAPFPYFGGKAQVANLVWARLGTVPNYVEPFFGSGAMLLGRPEPITGLETVNDLDGMIANFWRALKTDPEQVAEYADNPVNECDLHARHFWLVTRKPALVEHLMADPEYYDPKAAGWWVWGISCWIGAGFCSGDGAWVSDGTKLLRANERNDLQKETPDLKHKEQGIRRKRPHLKGGQGIQRKKPYLRAGQGIQRKRPHLRPGQGIQRIRPHLRGNTGTHRRSTDDLKTYFNALAARLRHVRVCCGDWTRVMGPSVTFYNGLTGIFLDPPYGVENRAPTLYNEDAASVSAAVQRWAVEHGENPLLRIALCGYEGEHVMPESWTCVAWKTQGGYGLTRKTRDNLNPSRERIWFSPHCLIPELTLW